MGHERQVVSCRWVRHGASWDGGAWDDDRRLSYKTRKGRCGTGQLASTRSIVETHELPVIESLKRIILASTSPYRRALLERLDIPFEQRSPPVDEDAYRHLEPVVMARELAKAKAESIHEDAALIIGSDQVVEVEGRVLGKPCTEERAIEQLLSLAGRSHRLVTAVAVHDPTTQSTEMDVDIHTLTMRPLSRDMITKYVRADQPLDCAGAYKLECRGIALFERIDADPSTADDTAIVGLPLMKLCALLRKLGVEVLDP